MGVEIARGGMGVVQAAVWQGKQVAVKSLLHHSSAQLAAIEQVW